MSKKSKKILAVILSIAAVLAIIFVPQRITKTLTSDLSITKHTSKNPLYAAHRGLSALHPQNTLPAFKAAVEAGYDAFEFDIHTTSDGEWVVIHNDSVDEMTDGQGEVENFTLDELIKLNIDSGNGIKNYDGLKIPTLEQTLSICDDSEIIPIIEIKKCDMQYIPDFLQMLDNHDLLNRAIIISFEFDYLKRVRELNDSIEMMYLVQKVDKSTVDLCLENGNIGIDFYGTYLPFDLSGIKYAKQMGLKLGAWTVDTTIAMDILVSAGADIITTNRIIP